MGIGLSGNSRTQCVRSERAAPCGAAVRRSLMRLGLWRAARYPTYSGTVSHLRRHSIPLTAARYPTYSGTVSHLQRHGIPVTARSRRAASASASASAWASASASALAGVLQLVQTIPTGMGELDVRARLRPHSTAQHATRHPEPRAVTIPTKADSSVRPIPTKADSH